MIKRIAKTYKIKSECVDDYIAFHTHVWPEILEMISACNIRNYSIYNLNGQMFSYYEYVGSDYEADMAKMAADSKTQEWWAIMKPMGDRSEDTLNGEFEEVFHLE
jgi:L-rhamnose mutarotase